ncbi:hypothetical protein [Novosphingobium decolorationis]|uniref:Uncharacterized protein n=1 Tax=Novosphingobium decolorationis TaxID=2698673 RepID=A0ABX8E223_9SPHN|nr:hypothetical protein [Novosphingobium decolorationis]QVM83190.1 hypothetical protein HT578_05195 [Novosphingobium decolorationis]
MATAFSDIEISAPTVDAQAHMPEARPRMRGIFPGLLIAAPISLVMWAGIFALVF